MLSPSQEEAVCHGSGPCLTLAGPGSGKTYVLTRRIQHLITKGGVPPEQILVITFTKAAALEMKENIRRCEVVASLHEKVAKCEMVKHELLDDIGMKQRTTFSDGTTVTVDFAANHYEIC